MIPLPVPVPVVPAPCRIISVPLPADTSRIGQDYTTTAPCASQDIRLVLDGEGSGTTGSYSDGIGSFPVNDVPKYRSPSAPCMAGRHRCGLSHSTPLGRLRSMRRRRTRTPST